MFKIFYGVLLSALILIVSIACSSTDEHEQEYNKLLAYTSELETRLSKLEAVVSRDIYLLDLEHAISRPDWHIYYKGTDGTFKSRLQTTIGKNCYKKDQTYVKRVEGNRFVGLYDDLAKDFPEGCMP